MLNLKLVTSTKFKSMRTKYKNIVHDYLLSEIMKLSETISIDYVEPSTFITSSVSEDNNIEEELTFNDNEVTPEVTQEVFDLCTNQQKKGENFQTSNKRPEKRSAHFEKSYRSWPAKKIPQHHETFCLGSSFLKHIYGHNIAPKTTVHSYSGSKTIEKIMTIRNYPKKKMKNVILQDGTNSISFEKGKTVDELIEEHAELIELIKDKFDPERILVMQVPPILNQPEKIQRIEAYNTKLNELYCEDNKVIVIPIYDELKAQPNFENYYWDEIHFNKSFGIPFFVNSIKRKLIPYFTFKKNELHTSSTASFRSMRYVGNNYREKFSNTRRNNYSYQTFYNQNFHTRVPKNSFYEQQYYAPFYNHHPY